ncbi:MAG: succinate dehydrogenase assembly factor 2 [Candidatus Saccharibacteria bacterium]|nr:succinate dehydrogenase assembly factor 2 [Pseudorhodobacter sp.]
MMETAQARLKRMVMRSWRRGTKEMDLVLGPYADVHLATMGDVTLGLYDDLLEENDQELITWVMGTGEIPPRFAALVADISGFARQRLR